MVGGLEESACRHVHPFGDFRGVVPSVVVGRVDLQLMTKLWKPSKRAVEDAVNAYWNTAYPETNLNKRMRRALIAAAKVDGVGK